MIEEKRKMDPPIKSEDDRVWVAEDDAVGFQRMTRWGFSCY
jgi:hypothetical protein